MADKRWIFVNVNKEGGISSDVSPIKYASMAKDPAVLFYTSDFLSGTSFFTQEQRGQYIQLLCEQHQLWSIPKNHMISVCGSLDSPVVGKFTIDENGNYYNIRMRQEAVKRRDYSKSRSNNRLGKVKNSTSYDPTCDYHMIQHMEDGNINSTNRTNRGGVGGILEKWFSGMEDVKNSKALTAKYLKLYPEEIIERALNNSACTSRAAFVQCCEHYKTNS